jgi:hypothetical protein
MLLVRFFFFNIKSDLCEKTLKMTPLEKKEIEVGI